MIEFFRRLFETEGFPPRWNCGTAWSETPALGWLHIVSDLVIATAYFAIPVLLGYLAIRKNKDMPFIPLYWLFAAFILSCGTVHLVEAILFWDPIYRFSGLVKVITAVVSVTAVIVLAPSLPRMLALPGLLAVKKQLNEETDHRRETENRLRVIFQSASDGLWEWNVAKDRLWYSDQFLRILGLREEEAPVMLERFLTRLVHPEDIVATREMLEKHLKGDTPYDIEHRLRHKDGYYLWLHCTGRCVRDEEGKPLYMGGYIKDLTDKRQQEQRFQAVFEQAAVGIARVSPSGDWLEVNQKICDIVGYSREELMALTFQEITHPEDLDKDLKLYQQLKAGKIKNYSMRKRYYHKTGRIVWINLTVSLVRNSEGVPLYAVSVVEDITEKIQLEMLAGMAPEPNDSGFSV